MVLKYEAAVGDDAGGTPSIRRVNRTQKFQVSALTLPAVEVAKSVMLRSAGNRERSVRGEGSVRFGSLKHQRRGRVKRDGRLRDDDGNVAVRGSDGQAGQNGDDHRRDEPEGTIRAPLVRAYVEGPAHGSPGT